MNPTPNQWQISASLEMMQYHGFFLDETRDALIAILVKHTPTPAPAPSAAPDAARELAEALEYAAGCLEKSSPSHSGDSVFLREGSIVQNKLAAKQARSLLTRYRQSLPSGSQGSVGTGAGEEGK